MHERHSFPRIERENLGLESAERVLPGLQINVEKGYRHDDWGLIRSLWFGRQRLSSHPSMAIAK